MKKIVILLIPILNFLFVYPQQHVQRINNLHRQSEFNLQARYINANDDHNFSDDDVQKMKYVPGEIIVKYSIYSDKSPAGIEILPEYEKLKNEVEKVLDERIKVCRPVFTSVVDEMIKKNITENQLKEEYLNKRSPSKRRINIHSQNTFLQNEFSRIVLIRLSNYDADITQIADQIINNSILRNAGFIIEYAEPNHLYYTNYIVNDPLFNSQWSHTRTNAAEGWNIERGNSNIKIGIIDTGIEYLHEDLIQNYKAEFSYDFVDIDTAAYKLKNLFPISGEDYTVIDDDPKDFNGHGTHVAGIAGAAANNGKGIAGVAHYCSIIALRAGFSIRSGSTELGALEDDDIANAIVRAILVQVDVLNMSFGGPGSQTMNNSIKSASENGIVLIAAAGNSSSSTVQFPAGYNNVISVSSTNSLDKRSDFSNYGKWIDIAAPGESIISTVPTSGGSLTSSSGYRYLSGTSMAAPYVAGLAVLLLSKESALTPNQIEYILTKSSDIPGETANYIGRGRVNVLNALQLNTIKSTNVYAGIFSPDDDHFCNSNIDIIGTAGGNEFILEYGYGIYPSNWTEINRGSYLQNGLLGTLNIDGLTDGRYTIRLTAWDAANEKEIRISIRIGDLEGIRTGFPLTINDDISVSTFTLSDLDGDGTKEIIVVCSSFNPLINSMVSNLYIYNSEGKILPGWPKEYQVRNVKNISVVVADINNDGKKEIILYGNFWFQDISAMRGSVVAIDISGIILNGWPQRIPNYSTETVYISTADIDLDGELEIILGSAGQLHAFKYDGTYLPGWPIELPNGYNPRSPIVLTNIDSDPQLEVLVTLFAKSDPNNSYHYTYAFNHDGFVTSDFPYTQTFWGWTLAGGDINNDGKIEIITQNGPISSMAQKLPWNRTNMYSYSQFTIGNVNEDPFLEILYGDADGKAYLCNYKGETLVGWPIREQEFTADGSHIIADLTGDDKPEIIICWAANTVGSQNQKTGLYAYNVDGTTLAGFPKLAGLFTLHKVAVDDIDNDGYIEIVGMDYHEKKIFVWDMDKPYKSEWPIYQNNTWLTGVYSDGTNILSKFESFSLNEDDTLKIQISPNYVNWHSYNVQVNADQSEIIPLFENGILKVMPEPNRYGQTRIYIALSDGHSIDSTSFTLNVLPINDPPVILSFLPDVSIDEDTYIAVIVSDLADYFYDVDKDDHLTFSAFTIDPGLDSLVISNFENPDSAKTISKAFTIKRKKEKNDIIADLQEKIQIISSQKKFIDKKSDATEFFNRYSINSQDTSGVLSLAVYPSENFNGKIRIVISAIDDSLAEVKDTLELTIIPLNDKPVISAISDQEILEDDSLNIILNAIDIDNDSLFYSAYSSIDSLDLLIEGNNLKIQPFNNWNGSAKITVVVADNIEADSTQFHLIVLPINDPPVILSFLPDVSIDEDTYIAVIVSDLADYFYDVDKDDHLTFSAFTIDPGLDSLVISNFENPDSAKTISKAFTIKRKKEKNDIIADLQEKIQIISSQKKFIDKKSDATEFFNRYSINSQDTSGVLSLAVYPSENFNGKIRIVISAIDDSLAEVKDTLELTINKINDKPESFSLISPNDEEEINITDSTVNNFLNFLWEKAVDADNDSINYILFISDSLNTFISESITDTLINFPYSNLLGWFNIDKIECKWYVAAYDLIDTTYAINGPYSLTFIIKIVDVRDTELPTEYALYQNYPNPFNSSTKIKFALPAETKVSLRVYDILGDEISILIDKELSAGIYNIDFATSNASSLASGIYFYSLQAGDFNKIMKMILLK